MTAPAWRWIKESAVLAIHDAQIAEHGGLSGLCDESLLHSAFARPQSLDAYGAPDLAGLVAACAVVIARNRIFLDANKRTAWVVAEAFLLKNGYDLIASDRDGVTTVLAVADGTMSEPELALWLRSYIQPSEPK